VLDVFSRLAVGWAIDRRAEKSLVNRALDMAANSQKTTRLTIIYADHRSQFTSWELTENTAAYKIKLSMGAVSDCYDNAMIEAFWRRMQTELLDHSILDDVY